MNEWIWNVFNPTIMWLDLMATIENLGFEFSKIVVMVAKRQLIEFDWKLACTSNATLKKCWLCNKVIQTKYFKNVQLKLTAKSGFWTIRLTRFRTRFLDFSQSLVQLKLTAKPGLNLSWMSKKLAAKPDFLTTCTPKSSVQLKLTAKSGFWTISTC